jgi:hypothetical protein
MSYLAASDCVDELAPFAFEGGALPSQHDRDGVEFALDDPNRSLNPIAAQHIVLVSPETATGVFRGAIRGVS